MNTQINFAITSLYLLIKRMTSGIYKEDGVIIIIFEYLSTWCMNTDTNNYSKDLILQFKHVVTIILHTT
jgi:hypothetical protein